MPLRFYKKENRQLSVGNRTIVKPKRPCPAFGSYVQYFRGQQPLDMILDRNFVRAASVQWKRLPIAQKGRFKQQHIEAMVGYREQLAVWKKQKAFLKKPASPFNLFTKDIWKREGRRGRSFQQMSTYITQRWRTLSEDELREYQERYARGKLIYEATVRDFENGTQVDLDRSLDPDGDAVPVMEE